MSRKRTSITLDHALAARASKVLKVEGVSNVIEHCLKETLRRASLNDLADVIRDHGTQETGETTTPRRRSA